MKLAVLFWFYKELDICENHLKLLKKFNPDVEVFGLFGGTKEDEPLFQEKLGKYLADFYTSPSEDPDWKWINGDLMILDWYEKRGKNLAWDSICVVQWDMLVFDSLLKQFDGLHEGEIYISGTRELSEEIESQWSWTKPDGEERPNYLAFCDYAREKYGYTEKVLCSLFILEVFPKIFFEEYLTVENRNVGMLEYKIPTYAKIFGIAFYEKDFGVWWFDAPNDRSHTPLNAYGTETDKAFIESELKNESGARIFHPYFQQW